MYCPHCGERQPPGAERCAACGTPFTRRAAASRPPAAAPSRAVRYRTYQRGSGVRGSILGWLFVIVLAVVIVLGVGTYLSTSVIGPYAGASVNDDGRDQAAVAASPVATTAQEDAVLPADGEPVVITADEVNAGISQRVTELGPVDSAHVEITDDELRVTFDAYGLSATYHGQVRAQDGGVVVTNGEIDGPLGWLVPVDQVESTLNAEVASALAQRGVTVNGADLQPGQLIVTVAR